MANQTLFQTFAGKLPRRPDAINHAGAPAYAFEPRHALAQLAATGCFRNTYYVSAELQLDEVLRLCDAVPPELIAKTAIYARQRGLMKDMPALLCALLSVYDAALCERIFDRVIDDGKMLRNFVQIIRSGQVGRKSLGSLPKRLVQRWFSQRSDEEIFRASVGQSPSVADILKLAHPRPETASRRALYAYLVGRPHDAEALPPVVQAFEHFKLKGGEVPDVPFQLLTSLPLDSRAWRSIARNATWQQTRMNLAAFVRHGVFAQPRMKLRIAERLRDKNAIRRARVMPYQLLSAYLAAGALPEVIREALQDALDVSLANVPSVKGRVFVCCDVSGSMSAPITGYQKGATSKVRCIDVAALVAAAMLRKNDCEALAFEERVVPLLLNRRDSVMSNALQLASIGGGGTNCSAPLAELNQRRERGALVLYVSDNESWVDAGRNTGMMKQWAVFKARNPDAKLVCIDLSPNRTTQAHDDRDVLNIGGFSDVVFEVIAAFVDGAGEHWVETINKVEL